MKKGARWILSLDLGSTTFKAGVFDPALCPIGSGSASVDYVRGPGGEVELEPGSAADAIHQAIRKALQSACLPASRLSSMAITSQAQTFTTAGADGSARHLFLSWQDQRAAGTCAALRNSGRLRDFSAHSSFGEPLPGLQLCQLLHRRQTGDGHRRPGDRILLLPTWLVFLLTGKAVVDDNLAAMSGLYSIPLRTWWPAALRATGLTRTELPSVLPIGSIAGFTQPGAKAFGLPAGLPVILAGNDQTSGAHAAWIEDGNRLLITLGTAQVAYRVCRRMPAPARDSIRGPYPGGLFYRMAADAYGGNLVNWARTVIAGCETDEAFFASAARAKPGCGGLLFRIGETATSGRWEGIGLHHTADDFARSVLETLTLRMTRKVRAVTPYPQRCRIVLAGGGSRQAVWRKMLSEALGAPVRAIAHDPLAGAARMARDAIRARRTAQPPA